MTQFSIFSDQQLIGHVDIEWLDPPMGVAGGVFQPLSAYEPKLHATFLGGTPNADAKTQHLVVRDSAGEMVACEAVGIRDAAETNAEIEILGIPYPAYAAYFSQHPHYKSDP